MFTTNERALIAQNRLYEALINRGHNYISYLFLDLIVNSCLQVEHETSSHSVYDI